MDTRRALVTRFRSLTHIGLTLTAVVLACGTWRLLAAPGVAPATTPGPVSPPALARGSSYADVVAAVAPSVVTIRVTSDGRGEALGSGVVVGPDGYVLTNHHVVDGGTAIRVDLADGRTLSGRLVGSDPPSDLALLKVEAAGLPVLPVGDSDAVRVGDVVLALGNPLGVGQTVTMGIISAKGRATGVGDGSYEDFLQTDAPINHGNSGGALVDARGALIGINAQILSTSDGNIGIGFAIPMKMAQHVVEALRARGYVSRGQLGVTVQTVTSDMAASLGLARAQGAIVADVADGSAGAGADLRQGDVITAIDGQPVESANALRNRVADAYAGHALHLDVLRDGRQLHLTATPDQATLGPSAAIPQTTASRGPLGITVAPMTPSLARELGLGPAGDGLLITAVADGSPADAAGVRPGDMIAAVNRQPVRDPVSLRRALTGDLNRPVLLLVNRMGHALFLTVSRS